jgi:hypothetical protein
MSTMRQKFLECTLLQESNEEKCECVYDKPVLLQKPELYLNYILALSTLPTASTLAAVEPPTPPLIAASNPTPSTGVNLNYEPTIEPTMLASVPPGDIQIFREYLRTIRFLFPEIAPTTLGRLLLTEGDIRMFFESSILLPVWPIALVMVPTADERNEDLILTSESTYRGLHLSRPDCTIGAYSGNLPSTTILNIEYKGPQALESFQRVLVAASEGGALQTPAAWETVTRQLRKYVEVSNCRCILCSDGAEAYVFIFPPDASQRVYALRSARDETGSLTLREAVLFAIYAGIELGSAFTHRYVYIHATYI